MTDYGYAGKILKVDLATGKQAVLPTSEYSARFLGGRGIAARIFWEETSAETRALSPENCLVFMTGPIAGFTRFAGCRWQICGKSPEMKPESFSYANLGGSWGAWLKYAGYDGLVVTGKAEKSVYLLFNDDRIEIREASSLRGLTTIDTQNRLQAELGRETRVLTIGPAAENQVTFATILAAENASGSSGFGSVMGSKNLKAIAIRVARRERPRAACPEKLAILADTVKKLRLANFEDYGHILPGTMHLTSCYGCISGCTRWVYEAEGGNQFKAFCQAAGVYLDPATRYYGDGTEANLLAERLCDKYGLDTAVMSPLIEWLEDCYQHGILQEKETDLPLSRIGSIEFIEKLVRLISYRQGFGDLLAQGISRAAKIIGKGADQLLSVISLTPAGEYHDYDPRLILTNAMIYATEPRRAVHLHHATVIPLKRWLNWIEGWQDAFLSTEKLTEIACQFWGSREALDFNSYHGKALAAKKIQDYGYLKESLILCDLAWPIYQVKPAEKYWGFYSLESQILSAITGREFNEEMLAKLGERIFNLQRAIMVRQGWLAEKGDTPAEFLFKIPLKGTFFDPESIVPDANGKPISRKGAVINKTAFDTLKKEYYELRGWDSKTGYQTRPLLEKLDLADIADELASKGLLR